MAKARKPTIVGRHLFRALLRISRIYWGSPDRNWGLLLLALTIALELGTVYANVAARRRGAPHHGRPRAAASGGVLRRQPASILAVMLGFVLVSTYRIYMRQALEIRWRRGLTGHYLERWIGRSAYCQAKLHRDEVDNPDQRIAEDVRDFVASALGLSLSLLSAVATLVSFGGLLWALSRDSASPRRHRCTPPGLMLWVAARLRRVLDLAHAPRGPPARPDQLRPAALRGRLPLRAGALPRQRRGGGALARRGPRAARLAACASASVVENWWQLIRAQRNLTSHDDGIGQANGLVPLLVAAPAYIAGHLTLGSVAQIRFAYGQVSGALVWFVNAYQEIARWRASIERLATFARSDGRHRAGSRARGRAARGGAGPVPAARRPASSRRPTASCCSSTRTRRRAPGERIAIVGPSGAGKTTLLRAVAGIWPFGEGRIEVPAGARMLFVPQQALPPARDAARRGVVPERRGQHSRTSAIREALRLFGLGHLEPKLDGPGRGISSSRAASSSGSRSRACC